MATLTTTQDRTRTARRSLLATLSDRIAEVRARHAVLRELNQYSDRDLADLGITRADFSAIADGTYRRT